MKELFPLLSIETTSELCSVAVLFDENKYADLNYRDKHIHSESLVLFIENLLNSAKLTLRDIKAIAVSSGPGSFTGIRIGYSAAKGIAFGLDIPVIPVPTFSAFALEISDFYKDDLDFAIAVKANTTEYYFGEFSKSAGGLKEITSPQLINKSDLSIYAGKKLIFSDADEKDTVKNYLPKAYFVGKWAFEYGRSNIKYDFDFIEPNYIKKFIPKVKDES